MTPDRSDAMAAAAADRNLRDPTSGDPVPDDPEPANRLRTIARVTTWVTFAYLLAVEAVLIAGFVCLLAGVEPSTWFVDWIYRAVERAMAPLRGVFGPLAISRGGTEIRPTVESSLMFAMIAYGIAALAAHDLLEWLGGAPRPRRRPRS